MSNEELVRNENGLQFALIEFGTPPNLLKCTARLEHTNIKINFLLRNVL